MRAVIALTRWAIPGLLGLLLLLAAPQAAFTQTQATPDPQLDALFTQLRHASDAKTARDIDRRIQVIWLTPKDPELAERMSQALTARRHMNLPMALGVLSGIVRDYPTYAEGWNQRATVYYLLRDYEDSLADIEKTLHYEPRHFGALSGRALIYLAQDKRGLAIRDISAALAVHPFLSEKALFPELLDDITHI